MTYRPHPRLLHSERLTELDWQNEAACRLDVLGLAPSQVDEIFFPPSSSPLGGQSPMASKPAKLICASCPVKEQCLQYALDNNEQYGIWGGTTPGERRSIRRAARRAA